MHSAPSEVIPIRTTSSKLTHQIPKTKVSLSICEDQIFLDFIESLEALHHGQVGLVICEMIFS